MINDQLKARYGNTGSRLSAPSGRHPMAELNQAQAHSMSNPDLMRQSTPPADSAERAEEVGEDSGAFTPQASQDKFVAPINSDTTNDVNATRVGAGIFGGEGPQPNQPGEDRTPRSVYGY